MGVVKRRCLGKLIALRAPLIEPGGVVVVDEDTAVLVKPTVSWRHPG